MNMRIQDNEASNGIWPENKSLKIYIYIFFFFLRKKGSGEGGISGQSWSSKSKTVHILEKLYVGQ